MKCYASVYFLTAGEGFIEFGAELVVVIIQTDHL
jgi:hypothetical protein